MKLRCPQNPDHKRFMTTAHVQEEWIIDENADWLETTQTLDTVAGPDPANDISCVECGCNAEVED